MTDGRSYDINHPDQAMTYGACVVVPDDTKRNNSDSLEFLSLGQVVRLEMIEPEFAR